MSDQQLHIQRQEIIERNRQIRLAAQAEAQRLADQRRVQQQAKR